MLYKLYFCNSGRRHLKCLDVVAQFTFTEKRKKYCILSESLRFNIYIIIALYILRKFYVYLTCIDICIRPLAKSLCISYANGDDQDLPAPVRRLSTVFSVRMFESVIQIHICQKYVVISCVDERINLRICRLRMRSSTFFHDALQIYLRIQFRIR